MRDDFLDDELFGNEAGEDETPERLVSYYLEKPENDVFFLKKETLRLCVHEKESENLPF